MIIICDCVGCAFLISYLFSGVHDKVFYFVKRVHQEQDQVGKDLCD